MTRQPTEALKVACDGHGCYEVALISNESPDMLPDGWLAVADLNRQFHAKPCLVGYLTLLGVTRRDGSGLVVGQTADYGLTWISGSELTPVAR